jgi:ABC-type Fe3+ transport system substrate-binding protein
MLLIPNAIGITRNTPHPDAAQKLFDYLQTPGVLEKLVAARALEGSVMPASGLNPKSLDWAPILRDLPAATTNLSRIFLR